jgi:hypothetical protein
LVSLNKAKLDSFSEISKLFLLFLCLLRLIASYCVTLPFADIVSLHREKEVKILSKQNFSINQLILQTYDYLQTETESEREQSRKLLEVVCLPCAGRGIGHAGPGRAHGEP